MRGVKYQDMSSGGNLYSGNFSQIFRRLLTIIGILTLTWLGSTTIFAQGTSSNYQIDESFVGPGALLESNSASYGTSLGTTGDTATGESSSSSFRTHAGFTTTDEPRLAFSINSSTVNLGSLSTTTTATATSTFSVLNYTSYGYAVLTTGTPPKSGGYTLAGMSSTGPSQVGVEQFGINLRANTSPATFGADPIQVPTGFAYGEAASGYATVDNYRYVAGETIAQATQSSGQTDYTISYIANISEGTAGGTYGTQLRLICVGTY